MFPWDSNPQFLCFEATETCAIGCAKKTAENDFKLPNRTREVTQFIL